MDPKETLRLASPGAWNLFLNRHLQSFNYVVGPNTTLSPRDCRDCDEWALKNAIWLIDSVLILNSKYSDNDRFGFDSALEAIQN